MTPNHPQDMMSVCPICSTSLNIITKSMLSHVFYQCNARCALLKETVKGLQDPLTLSLSFAQSALPNSCFSIVRQFFFLLVPPVLIDPFNTQDMMSVCPICSTSLNIMTKSMLSHVFYQCNARCALLKETVKGLQDLSKVG